jgi:hypothetical protein
VERWLWILLIVTTVAATAGAVILAQGRRSRGRVVAVHDLPPGGQR